MNIKFLGAVRTTTGSMHLLEAAGKKILLDCGLYQGRRKEAFEINRNFSFKPADIDLCVLSHAHIDHSGNLPTLVKNGYAGKVFATPATRDLCEIMLLDSAHIQEQDVRFVNKRRKKEGKNLFEPLYEREDAEEVLGRFSPVDYESPAEIADGISLEFTDAGHILGAAIVTLTVKENGSARKLLFTGDLGRKDMPILKNPVIPEGANIVITESTYGNRLHESEVDVEETLKKLVIRAVEKKSRMIIPSFSVGRTQQIVYILNKLDAEGGIPEIPVYVDSPLSTKATKVYMDHPDCYDDETRKWIAEGNRPFEYRGLRYTQDVEESKSLNDARGPMIIISASGMCEAGRVLHHLARAVEDEKNIILITGYQAEHTLGRRIVNREEKIKIFGDEYSLRAEVAEINALSAHADKKDLVEAVGMMGGRVEKIFVVHGDEEANEALAAGIRKENGAEIIIPHPGDSFDV